MLLSKTPGLDDTRATYACFWVDIFTPEHFLCILQCNQEWA